MSDPISNHPLVILSDLHAHTWSAFASGDGENNSRLMRSLQVLRASLERANDLGCPWIFAGDIVHTAGYALNPVMHGIINVLSKFPAVKKVAVWGNHDVRGKGGKIILNQTVFGYLLHAVENLTIIDPSAWPTLDMDGIIIGGAGYQPRADLLDVGPGGNIGLFHQTVLGTVAPSGHEFTEGIPGFLLTDNYDISIVGHVHHPQHGDHKGRIMIPGSPEHHNFGDKGDHGWWVLDALTHELHFESGGSPEFLTVESAEEIKDDGNFYRVKILKSKEDLPSNATFIAPEPTTVEKRDLLNGISQPEEILEIWMKENEPKEGSFGLGPWKAYLEMGLLLLSEQDPVRLRPYKACSLFLHNFCSYENTEFHIPSGTWLIIGEGRDFPSNGAGKTTLVGEALYWLIFGKNTKGLAADEVIRWGQKKCSVMATLTEHEGLGSSLVVTRSRSSDGSSSLKVVQDGEDWEAASVSEMTQKLSRHLGLTPEIYQNLGYFSQEKVLLFASATDGERKGILADLIGLSGYQEAATSAASHLFASEEQKQLLQAKLDAHEEHRASLDDDVENIISLGTEWEQEQGGKITAATEAHREANKDPKPLAYPDRLRSIQTRIKELIGAKEVSLWSHQEIMEEHLYDAMSKKVEEALALSEEHREKYAQTLLGRGGDRPNASEENLEHVRTTLQKEVDLLPALIEGIKGLHEKKAHSEQSLQEASSAMVRGGMLLEGIQKDLESPDLLPLSAKGKCPTCGKPLGKEDSKRIGAERESFRGSLMERQVSAQTEFDHRIELKTKAQKEDSAIAKKITQFTARKGDLEMLEMELDTLSQVEKEIIVHQETQQSLRGAASKQAEAEIQRDIQAFRVRLDRREEAARSWIEHALFQHSQELARLLSNLSQLEKETNPHESALTTARERLGSLETEMGGIANDLDCLGDDMEIYEYWKKGFSKQGIQSLLMEEISTLFNRNRGAIFPLLTQGVFDVQFSTLSRTRAGELREKTEFLVTKRGLPVPYGSLSGGERRRVDIGIMITLSMAVSEWMKIPGILGMLVLDEVFGFLDSSGAEGLLEALEQVQEQIPSLFVITHDSHLQSLFPKTILIKQDEDGISHLSPMEGAWT